LEAEEAAGEHDEILQRAMPLFADSALAVVDERARRRDVGHVLDQEAAIAFTRRVESRRVVQAADEREQFGERDAHCVRGSTTVPEGVERPDAGSSVPRTPVTGRGTDGTVSVASVTRPAASGTKVPALTGSSAVSSQI